MSQNSKKTAYDVVNFMSESELADIIYYNGEENKAKKIAKYIVEHRKIKKIESTTELAEIIYKVIPKRFYQKIDPATKTFQAIRIYLNDELNNLRKALNFVHKLLKKGGRFIVVSFHSLEDKIVKDHLKEFSEPKVSVSKYHKNKSDDENNDEKNSKFVYKIISKKPFTPTSNEIHANQRSRSAKMRVAIKI
jgi:16S rRNA (cytosine1402-N4)-methyltransferase